MSLHQLLPLSRAELDMRLRRGHAIDPEALADTEYLGVSLGLPGWVERLTWKKFKKTFCRVASGGLRGWNVRVRPSPVDQPWEDELRDGRPRCWGHYQVRAASAYPEAGPYRGGLMIDYSAYAGPANPQRWIRDPLVALQPGDAQLLLGVSYLDLAGRRLMTPTYFALQRGGPLNWVEPAPAPG